MDDGSMADYYDPDHTQRSPWPKDEDEETPEEAYRRGLRDGEVAYKMGMIMADEAEHEYLSDAKMDWATFGDLGRMYVGDIVDQDVFWRTADGLTYRIEELGDQHVKNILRFWLRHPNLENLVTSHQMRAFGLHSKEPLVRGEMAQDALDDAIAHTARIPDRHYLLTLPVFKALRKRYREIRQKERREIKNLWRQWGRL